MKFNSPQSNDNVNKTPKGNEPNYASHSEILETTFLNSYKYNFPYRSGGW